MIFLVSFSFLFCKEVLALLFYSNQGTSLMILKDYIDQYGRSRSKATIFRNLPAMLSIPALFDVSISSSSFRTVACVLDSKEKFLPSKFLFLQ